MGMTLVARSTRAELPTSYMIQLFSARVIFCLAMGPPPVVTALGRAAILTCQHYNNIVPRAAEPLMIKR